MRRATEIYLRCLICIKVSYTAMVSKEVTTAKKFCSEVDVTIILEETIVVESEGMLNARKNDLLIFNVIDMLTCDNLRLFHRLDGVLFV